ncbi:argonaute PAZ domain-containing protein [Roseofilum sp. Guam]|uniref:argonaute PAZ domain-containing protein n=1 Tax=Roseofilum sp. Guam TaxID=2821502 RepID=UPI001B2C8448|nr:argonaute PAZ domain-containing protein [Roseofilum sp. Guam]MBP0028714.1 argonaute PAZ domain-containing protein [Roseofilum sp. Guam]
MTSIPEFAKTSVVLNRFPVKELVRDDLTVYEYRCDFQQMPEQGDEQRAISSIGYKVGVIAAKLGSCILTKERIRPDKMQSNDWKLTEIGTKILNFENPVERKVLETLERKVLDKKLKILKTTKVERASEGGLIWWITDEAGREKCGNGWEVHRGRRIDITIDADGHLYLDIDIHHRFYTPWTLHQWLENYSNIPITYVRNTYKDKNNNYLRWRYEDMSDALPQNVLIEDLDMSLADYHRKSGATEEEINNSRVVYVRIANQWNATSVPHLSQRLSPSLTMEMLANLADTQDLEEQEKKDIQNVLNSIRKNLNDRIYQSQETAQRIVNKVYQIPGTVEALTVDGYILPPAELLANNNQTVKKAAEVRYKGCAKVGETQLGCLNLFNDEHKYPFEVQECLKEIAAKSNTKINGKSYRTEKDLPKGDLEQQIFWQKWADEGIKTVLVVMPWSPNKRKYNIRVQALQAGIATQFIVPKPKADKYKALNVSLGLLCKAGWQPIRLNPFNDPEIADLIIGFDTGTNRELYYGTSAFAVLADGQSLGWELPDVQRGETFSGQAIWQTVSKLTLKFNKICNRLPTKLLLMRDGLVQEGEFEKTIKALKEQNIAVDVVGVRKSGAGRMGRDVEENGSPVYYDARMGSVVFTPKEKSFTLVSSEAINQTIGSVRPLRVVHEYGNTSLELLALQTYHLTQLHPASGFRSCRLPWVLHLADRSSKEFQRIRQISILQNLSREKLIAV